MEDRENESFKVEWMGEDKGRLWSFIIILLYFESYIVASAIQNGEITLPKQINTQYTNSYTKYCYRDSPKTDFCKKKEPK